MRAIIVPKVFTKKQCKTIISYHSDWSEKIGALGEGKEEKIKYNIRKCKSYFPSTIEHVPHWFYNMIFETVISENEKYFNFDLGIKSEMEVELNLLRYDSGDHYETHIDIGSGKGNSRRKLSFTLLLNDSYEGGKLEFIGYGMKTKTNPEMGDMIIFPSFLPHKVEPVTSGIRWTLVGWCLGDKHFI